MRAELRPSAETRAAWIFALAVAQPLVILLLSARRLGVTGAVSVVSGTASIAGQVMNVAIVGLGASYLLFAGQALGRGNRLLVFGAWGMAASLLVANVFSPTPESVRYPIYFAVALTAVGVGVRDTGTLITWARWATRLIIMVSLGAAVLAPTWAFIGEGTQGYDRTIAGIPRLTGLAPHPNTLSAVATTGLLLELGFRRGRRWFELVMGFAAALVLLLSQSYTGYVAAGVGVCVLLGVRYAAYRGLLATIAIALFAFYVFWPAVVVPARFQSSAYVESVSGRTTIWRLALDEWERHPLTGYGPSVFSPDYLSSHFPSNLQQATNGHNQLVQTLADSGLVGAAALIALFVGTLLCAWRGRVRDGGLSLALTAALCTWGLTETPMRTVGLVAVPALITLGIAITAARDAAEVAPVADVDPESAAVGAVAVSA